MNSIHKRKIFSRRQPALLGLCMSLALLTGCSTTNVSPSNVLSNAQLTPATRVTRDLSQLPEPKGKVIVAVYGFRDQTGQYKPAPDSSFSTSVTQGAGSMLVSALKDSGWFIPVERESLQNLLTERKIVRATEPPPDKNKPVEGLPALQPATVLIEGGIISFESNVRTGGTGARYMGIGANTQYRVDQVTVSLRSIDIRSGRVLNTVSVTKTIYSFEFSAGVYKFIGFQRLLESETGYTRNEPAQLAIKEAIEAAVVHLTVQGIRDHVWSLKDENSLDAPVIKSYLQESKNNMREVDSAFPDQAAIQCGPNSHKPGDAVASDGSCV